MLCQVSVIAEILIPDPRGAVEPEQHEASIPTMFAPDAFNSAPGDVPKDEQLAKEVEEHIAELSKSQTSLDIPPTPALEVTCACELSLHLTP